MPIKNFNTLTEETWIVPANVTELYMVEATGPGAYGHQCTPAPGGAGFLGHAKGGAGTADGIGMPGDDAIGIVNGVTYTSPRGTEHLWVIPNTVSGLAIQMWSAGGRGGLAAGGDGGYQQFFIPPVGTSGVSTINLAIESEPANITLNSSDLSGDTTAYAGSDCIEPTTGGDRGTFDDPGVQGDLAAFFITGGFGTDGSSNVVPGRGGAGGDWAEIDNIPVTSGDVIVCTRGGDTTIRNTTTNKNILVVPPFDDNFGTVVPTSDYGEVTLVHNGGAGGSAGGGLGGGGGTAATSSSDGVDGATGVIAVNGSDGINPGDGGDGTAFLVVGAGQLGFASLGWISSSPPLRISSPVVPDNRMRFPASPIDFENEVGLTGQSHDLWPAPGEQARFDWMRIVIISLLANQSGYSEPIEYREGTLWFDLNSNELKVRVVNAGESGGEWLGLADIIDVGGETLSSYVNSVHDYIAALAPEVTWSGRCENNGVIVVPVPSSLHHLIDITKTKATVYVNGLLHDPRTTPWYTGPSVRLTGWSLAAGDTFTVIVKNISDNRFHIPDVVV